MMPLAIAEQVMSEPRAAAKLCPRQLAKHIGRVHIELRGFVPVADLSNCNKMRELKKITSFDGERVGALAIAN
jgi:hypothetical protein